MNTWRTVMCSAIAVNGEHILVFMSVMCDSSMEAQETALENAVNSYGFCPSDDDVFPALMYDYNTPMLVWFSKEYGRPYVPHLF